MVGNITDRHILAHPILILRAFGARCYLRCITAMLLRKRTTFLDCACK